MAKSGSFSKTFSTGYTLLVEWSESNVDVANNQSDITVTAKLKTTGSYHIDSTASKNISITINGTPYSSTCTVGISGNSSKTLMTKTVSDITHGSDGSKTISISCTLGIAVTLNGTYVSSVSVPGSATLTTIARASSLTVSNGTLNTAQTITITRQDSSFKHKVKYSCGSASGYIAGGSDSFTTSTSISWTPPLSLAAQNTTGTTVSATITLYTYTSGGTSIGNVSKTITLTIPSSVKPSCSVSVSDATGYSDTYGWIKGCSKVKYSVSATQAQGSAITSYTVSIDGKTYTESSGTTSVLSSSGTVTVNVTVKDGRGRTGTASTSITVLDYTKPTITNFTVGRCNSDGTENNQGEYAKVTFSATVTSLSNKNTSSYKVWYRESSSSDTSSYTFTALENVYSVSDQAFIFAADSGKSYTISLDATDAFATTRKTTQVSTGFTLMHFLASGMGMALGKIAEVDNCLDVGFTTLFRNGTFVHTAKGTSGSTGFIKFASIKINNTYRNIPIKMSLVQRGRPSTCDIYIQFANENSADPALNTFYMVGPTTYGVYIVKSATSTWDLYIKKSESHDNMAVLEYTTHFNYMATDVIWADIHADSLPDGYTQATIYPDMYLPLSGGTLSGHLYFPNNKGIYGKDTSGNNCQLLLISASDNALIGSGSPGYTYIYSNVSNSVRIVRNGRTSQGILDLGVSWDSSYACSMRAHWADSSVHNIVGREADGLTASFGYTGSSTYSTVTNLRGQTIKCNGSTTWSSDENLKYDLKDFDDRYDKFFDYLEPLTYKYILGASGRNHSGYIAQKVEEALEKAGLTTQEFAGVAIIPISSRETEIDDNNSDVDIQGSEINYLLDKGATEQHNLAYTEFVALNTWQIQKLKKRLSQSEEEINSLKEQVKALQDLVLTLTKNQS